MIINNYVTGLFIIFFIATSTYKNICRKAVCPVTLAGASGISCSPPPWIASLSPVLDLLLCCLVHRGPEACKIRC